jgi:hypothetical protein
MGTHTRLWVRTPRPFGVADVHCSRSSPDRGGGACAQHTRVSVYAHQRARVEESAKRHTVGCAGVNTPTPPRQAGDLKHKADCVGDGCKCTP